MTDNDEQSIPSCGSHGAPVAWALMQPDSYSVFASRALAEKKRVLCFGGDIVPLYRSPTLTDEERDALDFFGECGKFWSTPDGKGHAATLRGLLGRLK